MSRLYLTLSILTLVVLSLVSGFFLGTVQNADPHADTSSLVSVPYTELLYNTSGSYKDESSGYIREKYSIDRSDIVGDAPLTLLFEWNFTGIHIGTPALVLDLGNIDLENSVYYIKHELITIYNGSLVVTLTGDELYGLLIIFTTLGYMMYGIPIADYSYSIAIWIVF